MRSKILITAIFVTLIGGCSAQHSSLLGSETVTSESDNLDIQLLSASVLGNVTGVTGDFINNCTIFDQSGDHAKADCTAAAEFALGLPMLAPYIEQDVTTSNGHISAGHWCGETRVVVAVKEAAFNSPNFREIGFYARIPSNGNEGSFVTIAKNDPRLEQVSIGTLKNGEKALFYKFGAAGPCESVGSGNNPSGRVELKPFVTYEGGLRRWEAVPQNHSFGYGDNVRRAEIMQ